MDIGQITKEINKEFDLLIEVKTFKLHFRNRLGPATLQDLDKLEQEQMVRWKEAAAQAESIWVGESRG